MTTELEKLLGKVYSKSFNIYQLLGKMKKSIGWLPDEVVNRICQSYLKNSHKITKPWPWFVKTAYECWKAYNAEQNIAESKELNQLSQCKEIRELIKGIG